MHPPSTPICKMHIELLIEAVNENSSESGEVFVGCWRVGLMLKLTLARGVQDYWPEDLPLTKEAKEPRKPALQLRGKLAGICRESCESFQARKSDWSRANAFPFLDRPRASSMIQRSNQPPQPWLAWLAFPIVTASACWIGVFDISDFQSPYPLPICPSTSAVKQAYLL